MQNLDSVKSQLLETLTGIYLVSSEIEVSEEEIDNFSYVVLSYKKEPLLRILISSISSEPAFYLYNYRYGEWGNVYDALVYSVEDVLINCIVELVRNTDLVNLVNSKEGTHTT